MEVKAEEARDQHLRAPYADISMNKLLLILKIYQVSLHLYNLTDDSPVIPLQPLYETGENDTRRTCSTLVVLQPLRWSASVRRALFLTDIVPCKEAASQAKRSVQEPAKLDTRAVQASYPPPSRS